MPSKSVLEQKQAYVADLAEKLKNAAACIFTCGILFSCGFHFIVRFIFLNL